MPHLCPRGGADCLPPLCSRYPTSAPTALPIASRHYAPGTLPLPRACAGRLPHWPALVRPVPHLCPSGGADCLPLWSARYPTSAPATVPIASRTCAPGTTPLRSPTSLRLPTSLCTTHTPHRRRRPVVRRLLPPGASSTPAVAVRTTAAACAPTPALHPFLPTFGLCGATSLPECCRPPTMSFHRHHWPLLDCAGAINAPPCPTPILQIVRV